MNTTRWRQSETCRSTVQRLDVVSADQQPSASEEKRFLVNIDVCDGSSHDIGIAMDVATAASCHATHIGDRDRVCFCANPENESNHQLLACW